MQHDHERSDEVNMQNPSKGDLDPCYDVISTPIPPYYSQNTLRSISNYEEWKSTSRVIIYSPQLAYAHGITPSLAFV